MYDLVFFLYNKTVTETYNFKYFIYLSVTPCFIAQYMPIKMSFEN